MIILDTDVVSEALKPHPSAQVREWVDAQPLTTLFITAISQAEMLLGARLLPGGQRRNSLESAVNSIFGTDFRDRVLSFDSPAARAFAAIVAQRKRIGRPINFMDGQIAAIAQSNRAAIATRDVRDFADCGIDVINPWLT